MNNWIDTQNFRYCDSTGQKSHLNPLKTGFLCAMGMCALSIQTQINWLCSRRRYLSPRLAWLWSKHKIRMNTLRGHPHGNAFVCKCTCFASYGLIFQTNPVNAVPVNALFWNLVSGWKNLKTLQSRVDRKSEYFAYWRHHRPTTQLLAFDLLSHDIS